MNRMTTTFLTIATAYLLFVGLLYGLQRKMMYLPDKTIGSPEQYGLSGFSDIRTKTSDGVTLQIWYRPAAEGFPTVAYFHGNAAHLGNRAAILSALATKGFGVAALSYRGYGKSEGSPNEQGLYHDARAALAFLTTQQGIPLSKIMLYGESLGTGVAVQMATEHDVAALVLEAPYTSVAGRAAEIYYYVPVRFLIHDVFDSLSKIGRVKAPLLLYHGELDPTIPVAHGKALYAAANAPKRAFFLPGVGHNDFDRDAISAHVLGFAREHRLVP